MKPFWVVVKNSGGAYCYTAWGESSAEVWEAAHTRHGLAYIAVRPIND